MIHGTPSATRRGWRDAPAEGCRGTSAAPTGPGSRTVPCAIPCPWHISCSGQAINCSLPGSDYKQVSNIICTVYCAGDVVWGTKVTIPGFPGVKQRVPGYSLLASSRVLKSLILASLKILLVPVTSIDKDSLYSRVPGLFFKGAHLYT